ncbi:hypothetical protein K432DRAFT_416609 [Lepidopterella palustris CBS 459.81]|uniref:Uncharacterized protein n=1 Tax=Lepidopterella palustris CBS 459.81 TaxID=1314670 RepID=A0A8E2EB07_9PEZI|nr:hypothetical protein K432DRAFT_416609 [Lepidopterella palustris CBS 459.81]
MGFAMVENLVKKPLSSITSHIFDVKQKGRASAGSSSKEIAAVPEGSHVRSVHLTPTTGVISPDLTPKLIIDCSTIETAVSLSARSQILEQYPSAALCDASVPGSSLETQRAALTMVGCSNSKPSSSIFACGELSLGLTATLCNNYCSGLIAIATPEAMDIGMRSGMDMDPRALASKFHTSAAQSTICDNRYPVPGICPDTTASGGAKLALGDTELGVYTKTMEDERCKNLDSRGLCIGIWERAKGGNDSEKAMDTIDAVR